METDSEIMKNSTHIPCVTEMNGFTSAFLFSIETQHTIGKKDNFHFKIKTINIIFIPFPKAMAPVL